MNNVPLPSSINDMLHVLTNFDHYNERVVDLTIENATSYLAHLKPREVDWEKVPIGTKLIVGDTPNKTVALHMASYAGEHHLIFCFDNLAQKHNAKSISSWRYFSIHPDVDIRLEWYKRRPLPKHVAHDNVPKAINVLTLLKENNNGYYYTNPDDNTICTFTSLSMTNINNITVNDKATIDWTKVPVNTKVLVSVYDGNDWVGYHRYFALYLPTSDILNPLWCFDDNNTLDKANTLLNWKHCKLHPDVHIKKEWYK